MRKFTSLLLTFLLACVSVTAEAWDKKPGYRLLRVEDTYFEARRIWHRQAPFWDYQEHETGEPWVWGVTLGLDLALIDTARHDLRFDNRVEGDSTDHQFRRVSWEYDLFYEYRGRIGIGWKHQSQHLLDVEYRPPYYRGGYPLDDDFYIRIRFK